MNTGRSRNLTERQTSTFDARHSEPRLDSTSDIIKYSSPANNASIPTGKDSSPMIKAVKKLVLWAKRLRISFPCFI